MVRALRVLAVLTVLALVTVACGDADPVSVGEPQESGEESPTPTDAPVAPVPAASGLQGVAVRASDVQTMPDSAAAGAAVLVVPADEAAVLWSAAGVEPPGDVGRVMVRVPTAAVDGVGQVADLDAQGGFHVDVADGRYLLCLGERDGDAIVTQGCGEVTAPASALRVSTGEAGFVAQ